MDEDISNDVVLIDDEDSLHSNSTERDTQWTTGDSRPLMSLFGRLISNDTKSNTILTNAQILSILTKEFDMDVNNLHPLEIDIYINIVKKFLKDWPQWDNFDRIMSKLKKNLAHDEIKTTLEEKYKHLKTYLQSMITIATPLTNEAVEKAKKLPENKTQEINDIVLELYCTRKMLNTFIFSQPNAAENNSLFNLSDYEPLVMQPNAPSYSFSSLLHWYGVRLIIDLPYFQYTRYTAHKLKHVLVNDKNGPRDLKEELDTSVFMKQSQKTVTASIILNCINNFLDNVLVLYANKIEYDMIMAIFQVIKNDIIIDSSTLEVPGSYKQYLNKYPYVRKLNSEVSGSSHHNIYIEERITPIQDWHLGRFVNLSSTLKMMPPLQSWLKFECGECKQNFNGAEFLTSLREHFKICHVDEPDWTCVNCQKSFTMQYITHVGWKHNCE